MADGLSCIVCTEVFFFPHTPMVFPCGHTTCKVCIEEMKKEYNVKCPVCRVMIGNTKAINDLKENYEIKKVLSDLEMLCTEDSKASTWVCVTHCEPLCDCCSPHHRTCDKKHILEARGELEFQLAERARALVQRVPATQELASRVAGIANESLKNKVSLCQLLVRMDPGEDPRMRHVNQAKTDFKSINSYLLTTELLGLVYYTPESLEECEKLASRIHSLVDVRITDDRYVPEYMFCLRCWGKFHKNQYMRILPCYKVQHLVCETCAQEMVMEGVVECRLDGRRFNISDLSRLQYYWLPPNTDDGNVLGSFVPVDRFMCSVDLFRHLQPHVSLPPEQRVDNFRGYYFNPSSTQVEALTFLCFGGVTIGGIGLSNPVEPGTLLTIEYVKFYAGVKAAGSPIVTTSATPQILPGGGATNTDVKLGTPFTVSACSPHTIKIQFRRKPGELEPVLMYRGNHRTRPVKDSGVITGSDGVEWEFYKTEGVERSESCPGQHFITGPILRLIYRPNK